MKFERILILDTETTGLSATDRILEVGLILYSVRHHSPLIQFSALLPGRDENPCEWINHIPAGALIETSSLDFDSHAIAANLRNAADAIIAHRAEFDSQFFDAASPWHRIPWICSKFDMDFPRSRPGRGEPLVSLALAHGIGVSTAHRALTDCLIIAEIFNRLPSFGWNLADVLERASRPKALFVALVSYEQRQLAKDAGFQWNDERHPKYPKTWTRRMFIDEASALSFKTRKLE